MKEGGHVGYDIGLPDFQFALKDHRWLVIVTVLICLLLAAITASLSPPTVVYSIKIRTVVETPAAVAERLNDHLIWHAIVRLVAAEEEQERLRRRFTVRAGQDSSVLVEARGEVVMGTQLLLLLKDLGDLTIKEERLLLDARIAEIDANLAQSEKNIQIWKSEEEQFAAEIKIAQNWAKVIEGEIRALTARGHGDTAELEDRLETIKISEAEARSKLVTRQAMQKSEIPMRESLEKTKRSIAGADVWVAVRPSSTLVHLNLLSCLSIGFFGGLCLSFAEVVFLAHRARRRRAMARA